MNYSFVIPTFIEEISCFDYIISSANHHNFMDASARFHCRF